MKDADVGHCAFERTPTQSLRVRMEYQHSLLDFLPPAWTVLDLLRNSSTSLCLKPEGFGGFFFLLSQSQSKGVELHLTARTYGSLEKVLHPSVVECCRVFQSEVFCFSGLASVLGSWWFSRRGSGDCWPPSAFPASPGQPPSEKQPLVRAELLKRRRRLSFLLS